MKTALFMLLSLLASCGKQHDPPRQNRPAQAAEKNKHSEYSDLPASEWTEEKVGSKIRTGMTRKELESIFGPPYSDRPVLGDRKCEWFLDNHESPSPSKDGHFGGFYVMFRDGRVTQWHGIYVYNPSFRKTEQQPSPPKNPR
jgi:hypothetical protein